MLSRRQHMKSSIVIMSSSLDGNPPPLHMIVCGTAGTSESQPDQCHCSCPWQCMPANCNHWYGRFPYMWENYPLSTATANTYWLQRLSGLFIAMPALGSQGHFLHSYIIVDEMSIIGQRMLAWIDKRLHQATGQLYTLLGGLFLILFGDFGQLPPVGDTPLYSSAPTGNLPLHSHTIYQLFTTVVILDQTLHQESQIQMQQHLGAYSSS